MSVKPDKASLTLGNRLRARRKELNLSAEAVALHVGCHYTRVYWWEKGNRTMGMGLTRALKLAELYRMDISDLTKGLL